MQSQTKTGKLSNWKHMKRSSWQEKKNESDGYEDNTIWGKTKQPVTMKRNIYGIEWKAKQIKLKKKRIMLKYGKETNFRKNSDFSLLELWGLGRVAQRPISTNPTPQSNVCACARCLPLMIQHGELLETRLTNMVTFNPSSTHLFSLLLACVLVLSKESKTERFLFFG